MYSYRHNIDDDHQLRSTNDTDIRKNFLLKLSQANNFLCRNFSDDNDNSFLLLTDLCPYAMSDDDTHQ